MQNITIYSNTKNYTKTINVTCGDTVNFDIQRIPTKTDGQPYKLQWAIVPQDNGLTPSQKLAKEILKGEGIGEYQGSFFILPSINTQNSTIEIALQKSFFTVGGYYYFTVQLENYDTATSKFSEIVQVVLYIEKEGIGDVDVNYIQNIGGLYLDSLQDVAIIDLQDKDVLVYNGGSDKFENQPQNSLSIDYENLQNKPSIPVSLSELTDDASHRLVSDIEKNTWNSKQDTLGYTAENTASKGQANGYAGLDGDGKVPSNQLPAIVTNNTFVINTEGAMLALSANIGDIAIRTDIEKSFILAELPVSTLSNWKELLTPTDKVTSVNGQVGVVVLGKNDIGLGNVPNIDATNRSNHTGQQAISTITNLQSNLDNKVSKNGDSMVGEYLIKSSIDPVTAPSGTDVFRINAFDTSRLFRVVETNGGHGWMDLANNTGNTQFLVRTEGGTSYLSAGNFILGSNSAGGAGVERKANVISTNTVGALLIKQNANTSASPTTGGAVLIDNSGNTGAGVNVFTNIGNAVGRLFNVFSDNPLFNQALAHFEYKGTANAVEIVNNGTGTGNQAFNIQSNNTQDSAVGIWGRETSRGTVKIIHFKPAGISDAGASALSLRMNCENGETVTDSHGIFIDTEGCVTNGKYLIFRSQGTDIFTVDASGGVNATSVKAKSFQNFVVDHTPTTTTLNLDFSTSSDKTISTASLTGNLTLTFTNVVANTPYKIFVTQGATPRNITFPTPTISTLGGNIFDGYANCTQMFEVYYTGSQYLISSGILL